MDVLALGCFAHSPRGGQFDGARCRGRRRIGGPTHPGREYWCALGLCYFFEGCVVVTLSLSLSCEEESTSCAVAGWAGVAIEVAVDMFSHV